MSSSLVVVYHRQPFEEQIVDGKTVVRSHRSPNGIVPTLRGFFQYFDKGTWVAWTEVSEDQAGGVVSEREVAYAGEHYHVSQVGLTPEQVHSFYKVTSKASLWPVLHTFPNMFDYDAADWDTFREVNRIFAKATCEVAEEGAWIWVHDYNLWLVPKMIRDMRPDLKIAFFHHTPFPSSDVFGVLPWRTEITESLLSCDRVGFHIPRYAENFAGVARAFGGARATRREPVSERLRPEGWALQESWCVTELEWEGRKIAVDSVPLGVNVDQIEATVNAPEARARAADIREQIRVDTMLFAVSRVDYTKGTLEMLQCYERLLQRRPDLINKIKLYVVCVAPAKGMAVYDQIQAEIEQKVGSINGKYSQLGWVPVVLFSTPLQFSELMSWYMAADVCWITPLRDGLNLVVKEYVAAKQGEPGRLILSEFTGAAVELSDAILTHPYSARSMDSAIDEALAMGDEQAREHMQAMHRGIRTHDLAAWTRRLLERFGVDSSAVGQSKGAAA
nr:glucosylglycerol-phosphate synthase [Oceanococcus sp. HetDA_MAG_MS8]